MWVEEWIGKMLSGKSGVCSGEIGIVKGCPAPSSASSPRTPNYLDSYTHLAHEGAIEQGLTIHISREIDQHATSLLHERCKKYQGHDERCTRVIKMVLHADYREDNLAVGVI